MLQIKQMLMVLLLATLAACGAAGNTPATPTGPVESPAYPDPSAPSEGYPELPPADGFQRQRVPGIVEFYEDGSNGVIQAPERVAVGSEFEVTISTFGGGCVDAGDEEVSVDGSTATIRVFDLAITDPAVSCTAELKRLPHTVTLSFAEPGTATIEVHGVKVEQGGPPQGVPTVITQQITVE